MHKSLFKVVLSALLLAACNAKENDRHSTAPVPNFQTKPSITLLSDKKDYVCGMMLNDETIADTTLYDGKIYGFCNIGCKDEFLKKASEYLTQK